MNELKDNYLESKQKQLEWQKKKKGSLSIKEEFFHHHAYEIISTHKKYVEHLENCFKQIIPVKSSVRSKKSKKYKGIEAKSLNNEIRELLKKKYKDDIKFEVDEKQGVFYFQQESDNKESPIGGFDFAILNDRKNCIALRNICFGELHYDKGEERWKKFLDKNPSLTKFMKEIERQGVQGKNLSHKRKINDSPLLVGEIQFGNWALAYRDFFKVLKANVQNSVDCLIYIAPTGQLEKLLSDGIVTYSKTKAILEEFEKVVSVPVWLIGLDIDIK